MSAGIFTMHFRKRALLKYLAVSLIPSLCFVAINLLISALELYPDGERIEYSAFNGGAILFVLIFAVLALPKNHHIVVHENHLTEKDHKQWHIRTVQAAQISHYRKNFLGEIILQDINNQTLLRIEEDMTNFDRFEHWLTSHNIESKLRERY